MGLTPSVRETLENDTFQALAIQGNEERIRLAHGSPPGGQSLARARWPENEKPLGAEGSHAASCSDVSPIVPVSGLALAPWWLSPGCRAVVGPEPSRSLDIYERTIRQNSGMSRSRTFWYWVSLKHLLS
jgi:hypothetical protein